ncbi:MAG: esterase-like activity of phytase family protein, partial [Betaproteobacteria bacterium]|nr:esterase-like activity of phytase family protein [Betaproteobacteria bacterium]
MISTYAPSRFQNLLEPMMMKRSMRILAPLLLLGFVTSCGNDDPVTEEISVSSLRLIGQQILPRRAEFSATVVGGLSGIDYDAKTDSYFIISDDRTTTDSPNAPRFYTARLSFDANSFSGLTFQSVVSFKQPDGTDYPKVPDLKVADPESIRIDPLNGNLVWASEGDRTLTSTPARVINPFIREITKAGQHVREYELPSIFAMSSSDVGPRGNLTLEGLAFLPDGKSLAAIMEGPLFQDSATPTLTTGAQSRITVFDRTSGKATAQYAYPIEKVQAAPVPADQFTVNGATEILALSSTRFLVLERSFSVGVIGNQVRLYEIDISKATNVLTAANL